MKSKKYADVDAKLCVACGECTIVCPKDAVSVVNGCYAFVDNDKCVGCGLCSKNCPVGCISLIMREEIVNE